MLKLVQGIQSLIFYIDFFLIEISNRFYIFQCIICGRPFWLDGAVWINDTGWDGAILDVGLVCLLIMVVGLEGLDSVRMLVHMSYKTE